MVFESIARGVCLRTVFTQNEYFKPCKNSQFSRRITDDYCSVTISFLVMFLPYCIPVGVVGAFFFFLHPRRTPDARTGRIIANNGNFYCQNQKKKKLRFISLLLFGRRIMRIHGRRDILLFRFRVPPGTGGGFRGTAVAREPLFNTRTHFPVKHFRDPEEKTVTEIL